MFSSRQIKAYFIRFLTRKKTIIFDIKNTRNILFLRYDRIGDMVITTPVFRELKLAYPEINISVLASKLNRGVLVNNPYVDRIYTNHKNNFLGDLPTILKLRKMKFDVCVEFDHSVIPHAIIRLRIIKPKKVISQTTPTKKTITPTKKTVESSSDDQDDIKKLERKLKYLKERKSILNKIKASKTKLQMLQKELEVLKLEYETEN